MPDWLHECCRHTHITSSAAGGFCPFARYMAVRVKGIDLTGSLGDIKEDWGSGDPSGVQGRSPGIRPGGQSPPAGSRGRALVDGLGDGSPPEAEAFL